jgi:hypothetical protein
MLDLTTSGARGGARLRAIGVHHRAKPERGCFTAQLPELLLGERRARADALALRREDLDQIRALLFSPTHQRAQRVGGERGIALDR